MDAKQIKDLDLTYNLHSWSKQDSLDPMVVVGGEGIYYYDADGTRYSDMSSQLVNLNVGHGCKPIVEAIKEQAEKYCFISPAAASEPRAELAKMVIDRMPDNMGKVFFTNGGADANENAIKIARLFTGRKKVFSRYRSYHGSSFGAGNLTGEPRRYPLEPGIPGFVKFFDPYLYHEKIPFASEEEASEYYVSKLREQIIYEGPDQVAAVVMETITGSNGVIIPPKGYLPAVRRVCDEFGIMMICDEVMCGWCRTGKMFGFNNFDVKPDIVSFAKGITSGYVQLGGVAVSKEIAAYFDDHVLQCGLTYSGHPLACAAGIACLNFYDDEHILDKMSKTAPVLASIEDDLKERHACVGDVRHIGLFSAIELVRDKETRESLVPWGADPKGIMPSIIGKLKARGFVTYSHENNIIVAPPLVITAEQIEEEMAKMDEVLGEVDSELASL